MILTITRLILFALSMVGYIMKLQKKIAINIEFIPIISISILTIGLFLGGILNILPLISVLFFILGIILFFKETYLLFSKNKSENWIKKVFTPGIIFFFLFNIFFFLMLKDQRLIHYDNFSHWGLIVKNMLADNSLPNFENTTIQFSSYPPGSALFIYYFCYFVGKTEGLALFAQMFIILSGLLALFSFSSFSVFGFANKKETLLKKVLLNIITIFAVLYLLNGPSTIHNLLVDTLISIVGLSIFALIYYYFDSPIKIFTPLIFLGSFLILIKNSGMFFAYLGLLLYCISLFRYSKVNYGSFLVLFKQKKYILFPLISPLVFYYLWSKHVSMVFSSESQGKHTMSIESYINNFNEKTMSDITEITSNFIETSLSGSYLGQFILIIIILICLIIISSLFNRTIDKRIIMVLIIIILVFVLYNIGLWLMYLVSMPTGEAVKLAGYSRYMSTIMHYLMGIAIISSIDSLVKLKWDITFIIPSGILLFFLIFTTIGGENLQQTKSIFQNVQVENDGEKLTINDIDRALTNISTNQFISSANGKPYLVYFPSESEGSSYENYYLRYRLLQNEVSLVTNKYGIKAKIWISDFLVITSVTDEINEIFNKFSNEEPQIGTYKINKETKQILSKVVY